MRLLGWSLIQHDQCPCIKKRLGHIPVHRGLIRSHREGTDDNSYRSFFCCCDISTMSKGGSQKMGFVRATGSRGRIHARLGTEGGVHLRDTSGEGWQETERSHLQLQTRSREHTESGVNMETLKALPGDRSSSKTPPSKGSRPPQTVPQSGDQFLIPVPTEHVSHSDITRAYWEV